MESGWIIIDKPRNIGSTKVVSMLKKYVKPFKIGHAGTLDPLAEGVLPIAIKEATKLIRFVQDGTKEYIFTVSWGKATTTDDEEGDIIASSEKIPTYKEIESVIPFFLGKIEQIPPKYSAIKINGQRAYDLARNNQDFEIKSRIIEIFSLEIIKDDVLKTTFKTTCGKGTYIRSLARDIALKLGTYGHISFLRRTRVGKFSEQNAILLSKIESLGHTLKESMIPISALLDDIPAIAVTEQEEASLRTGKRLKTDSPICGEDVLVKSENRIVCIADCENGLIKPKRIILND